MQVDEFKQLVKKLHASGIEVILDVVFNHTAEGNEHGPTLCFKGLDNRTYYMLTPEGFYFNFSGTGNTLNCNNPVVRSLVIDCLRYWVAEYHIDGFRFDLASILGRDPWGAPLSNPPLLESLAFDPILSSCKLIAEAWDAGGLYQVGSFPAFGRWSEWNGRYRDCMRRFLKGDAGLVGEVAQRVQGSPDLYAASGRTPATSINFFTCHDGFTLADLVSYNYKHNDANGEDNRDGSNDNLSWNCGVEGPTDDPAVIGLRHRQMLNAFGLLLCSRGVPMIVMGDEVGRTQSGNNNAYCIDSPLTWLDWELLDANAFLHHYVSSLIRFRHAHHSLRVNTFDVSLCSNGLPTCSFHGSDPWAPDWSSASRQLAWMFSADPTTDQGEDSDVGYVIANMAHYSSWFRCPELPGGQTWGVHFNTGDPSGPCLSEAARLGTDGLLVGERSIVILANQH
jgi:glycogen operon protein